MSMNFMSSMFLDAKRRLISGLTNEFGDDYWKNTIRAI